MSSSTNSSFSESWTYHVFLSFRGIDTRRTFVSHLYNALKQKGIHTFKDDERLETGKSISNELLRAIEGSRFIIVIFSQNYASSRWCLDELAYIIKCKDELNRIVIPIFYDVSPSDVRNQRNSFADSFCRLESMLKRDTEKIQQWRKACTRTAYLQGHDLTVDQNNARCINEVVEFILKRLKPWKYDVFLNFRGADTRKTFVSYLYNALEKEGIHAFKEEEEVEKKPLDEITLKPIEESRFSIVIFSENYASSRWCLEELVHILKCKCEMAQLVIPIFYDVYPSHVRHLKSTFGESFSQLNKTFKGDMERIQIWRQAIEEVSNLSGFPSELFRDEAECIEKVVHYIKSNILM